MKIKLGIYMKKMKLLLKKTTFSDLTGTSQPNDRNRPSDKNDLHSAILWGF